MIGHEGARPASTGRADHSLNPSLPILPTSDAKALAAACRGAFVVVVETEGDRYRRRVFLTLNAAQRALERAQERGHHGALLVARLAPVAEVVA